MEKYYLCGQKVFKKDIQFPHQRFTCYECEFVEENILRCGSCGHPLTNVNSPCFPTCEECEETCCPKCGYTDIGETPWESSDDDYWCRNLCNSCGHTGCAGCV